MFIVLDTHPTPRALAKWMQVHGKARPEGYPAAEWAALQAGTADGLALEHLAALAQTWGREFTDWAGLTPAH